MKKILFVSVFLSFSLVAQADFISGSEHFEKKEYSAALDAFLPDADAGDKRSQYYVGYLYLNGYGVEKDIKKALRYLTDSANQNYSSAQSQLGYLYDKGEVVSVNKKKAIEYYKAAAEQNDTSAMFNLGLAYFNGNGVARDVSKAIELLQRVPDDNRPYVGRYLGDFYMNSSDPDKLQKAKKEYIRSARLNDLDAFYALAGIYEDSGDLERAVNYYTYAASKNHMIAQYVLGTMYIDGVGVEKDLVTGHAWLEIAANQGDDIAKKELDKLDKIFGISQKEAARIKFNYIQKDVIDNIDSPFIAEDNVSPVVPVIHVRPRPHRRR